MFITIKIVQLYHMIKYVLIKESFTIILFKCLFTISVVMAVKHLRLQQSGYVKFNVPVAHLGNSLLSFNN